MLPTTTIMSSFAIADSSLVAQDQVSSETDSWEGGAATRPDQKMCFPIDPSLVAPVIALERASAIIQLQSSSIIEIDNQQAGRLMGFRGSNGSSGGRASDLIGAEIGKLEEQKRLQLEEHKGGWSLASQDRLSELRYFLNATDTSKLRPFLSRAIAKNEHTGAFSASLCGPILWITHASLGESLTPSIRLPVVVFLDRAPTTVYVDWSMAR